METRDTPADGTPPDRLPPGLYVIGTPIGNLGDVTFRALETLRQADLVCAEDTRVTQRLLARHGIGARLLSCHRFNEQSRTDAVVARIRAGGSVALATDSGMPGVSDPGARMVAACREAGCPVTVVPGPSAVTAALALSGFESDGFRFAGFLPPRPGPRGRRLDALLREDVPVVLFESPHRIRRLLDELARRAPDRPLFVGRELTKRFEETRAGTTTELATAGAESVPRGEFVLVLAPTPRRRGSGGGAECG